LGRDYLSINGESIEIKILGEGIEKASGTRLTIDGEIFPLLFGFRFHLDARELAKANNIRMFVSYGKEIK